VLSEILECSSIYGFGISTICRVTSGSVANDEELKISNAPSNLTTLTFSNVNFEKIPKNVFTIYPKLVNFYNSYNNLNQLTADDFTNAKNLKQVFFYLNALTLVPSRVFEQCSVLEQITLADCPIAEIKEDAFYGLKTLKSLSLSNLPLKNFQPATFKDLTALQILRVENCSLKAITKDFFTYNSALTTVNFFGNNIELVEEGTFEKALNISSVDLSNNQLVTFSSAIIPSVVVNFNLLRNLHIGSQSKSISAESNFINNLTCDENLSARYLYLGNNSLSKLSCIGKMTQMANLQLDYNKIVKINKNIFLNIRNLTSLYIDGNAKLKLSSKVIAPMTQISRLQIDNFVNGYKNLNATFANLRVISINMKTWNCNRVKKVATVLNSQKIYMHFLVPFGEQRVCNLTTFDVNKIV
jgi:Leucine-rich repeat (LRR) protein